MFFRDSRKLPITTQLKTSTKKGNNNMNLKPKHIDNTKPDPTSVMSPGAISFALLLAASLLAGCASSGPRHSDLKNTPALPAPGEKGLVLIYDGNLPPFQKYQVFANGVFITDTLTHGSFYPYYAPPGPLKLGSTANSASAIADLLRGRSLVDRWLGPKEDLVELNVVAGQTYYVRMYKGNGAREHMKLVSAIKGEEELRNLHWVNPTAEVAP
jgi:hypothetical protein